MAKLLEILWTNGEKPAFRIPYIPGVHTKNDPKRMFGPHESSPFLDHAAYGVDYIVVKGVATSREMREEMVTWATKLATYGFPVKMLGGRRFVFLFGRFEDKLVMYFVAEDSGINRIEDIGVHISNVKKASKYMKRLLAPYQLVVSGSILEVTDHAFGQLCKVRLDDGYVINWLKINPEILNAREVAATNGQQRIAPSFLHYLGVEYSNLNVWAGKITAVGPIGLAKGYAHAQEGLKYDLVTYDTKEAVKYESFFFGLLGDLSPGELCFSDLQSAINFEQFFFLEDAARRLRQQVSDYLNTPSQHRGIVARYLPVRNIDVSERPNEWKLIRSLRMGMSILAEPSLLRSFVQNLMYQVLNMERGRVPIDHLARRADIVPDPHMFDDEGMIHLDWSVIPKGHMVFMDIPVGPTVEYRQPNGMALEHSESFNIHMRQFQKFEGLGRCFYGADLLETLSPKNGADLDDTQVVVFDPDMVKHIRSLTYPIMPKIQVDESPVQEVGPDYQQMSGQGQAIVTAFGARTFAALCQQQLKGMMQLGTVVNAIMMDTSRSGIHREYMMKWLAEQIQKETDVERKYFLLDCREGLANTPEYELRLEASNLEAIIDFCVQGKGEFTQFQPWLKHINEVRGIPSNVQEINNVRTVFPAFFGRPGRRPGQEQGRVTKMLQENVHYVFAPSLLDVVLSKIEADRIAFTDALVDWQWSCVTPVPDVVNLTFPSSPLIVRETYEVRAYYNSHIGAVMANKDRGSHRIAMNNLYREIEDLLNAITGGDQDHKMLIAVQMKRLVHHGAVPERKDGRIQPVRDGAFACDPIFHLYLDACEASGVAGRYEPVDIDRRAVKFLSESLPVTVQKGIVLKKDDHFWIGTVDLSDGDYVMVAGMIEVKKPHPDLLGYEERQALIASGEYKQDAIDEGMEGNGGIMTF